MNDSQIDNYFFIYFCDAEFDRRAHTGISENRKLLGDNKRTTPTPEVERPAHTTVSNSHDFTNDSPWKFITYLEILLTGDNPKYFNPLRTYDVMILSYTSVYCKDYVYVIILQKTHGEKCRQKNDRSQIDSHLLNYRRGFQAFFKYPHKFDFDFSKKIDPLGP